MESPRLQNGNSFSPYPSPLKDCVMIDGTKKPGLLIRQHQDAQGTDRRLREL
jgi:hypothetical protein